MATITQVIRPRDGVRARNAAKRRLSGHTAPPSSARNKAWFKKGAGRDEVHDWECSPRKVEQIEARQPRIAQDSTRTRVIANNYLHSKAMQ